MTARDLTLRVTALNIPVFFTSHDLSGDIKVCASHQEPSKLCWQRAGGLNPGLYAALST